MFSKKRKQFEDSKLKIFVNILETNPRKAKNWITYNKNASKT